MNTTGYCSPGYFCQQGVNVSEPSSENPHTGIGDVCPVGHFCPEGSSQPIPCEGGAYSLSEGQAECTTCPATHYCFAQSSIPVVCPTGYFCPEGTATFLDRPCPAGTFNNYTGAAAIHECTTCHPGEYCPTSGLATPAGQCDAGYYCFAGSITATPFDIGINTSGLCNDTFSECLCENTFFVSGGVCPVGHFCPSGSPLPLSCSLGMYCPYSMLSAPFDFCSEGFFCNGSSSTPEQYPCPAGHYCPRGSGSPIPCPLGTYLNTSLNQDQSSCLPCPGGKYCNEFGISEPSGPCSGGYFCPNDRDNKINPTPLDFICPSGHFCPIGSSDPFLCEAGSYQPYPQQADCLECPAGLYCDPSEGVEAVVSPQDCPQGYYCPAGTGFLFQPCPAGTYSNDTQLYDISNCTTCYAGSYCEGEALTEPSGLCFAGYFCTGGSDSPTPFDFSISTDNETNSIIWDGNGECPMGFYCPEGSRVPLPCPRGTFSQGRRVTNETDCEPCPRGRFCDFVGPVMLSEAPPCTAGFVCTGGSPTPTPDFDSEFGYPCPAGFFCEEGAVIETSCPPGMYNPDSAQGFCLDCTPGMRCPFSNMTTPLDCLAGYYCQLGTAIAQPCPQGTYSISTNLTSSDECSPCNSGKYCMGTGLTAVTGDCAVGYYCHSGASNPRPEFDVDIPENGPCPVGSYCPEGTIAPIMCPISTFRDTPGAANVSDCHPCTPGFYCEASNLTMPSSACGAGYYCPRGSEEKKPPEFICPVGSFCVNGSVRPISCYPGSFQPNQGEDSCDICPAGQVCLEGTSTPDDCPAHHFCPEGTGLNPLPCPPGTYTPVNFTGLRESVQCLPCPTGSYCRNGVISGSCSAGYFCLSGNPSPNPNITFDYSILEQCQENSTLQVCDLLVSYLADFYNSSLLSNIDFVVSAYNQNLTNQCDPISPHPILGGYCKPSHYCPAGAFEPIPCPEGTYNPLEGGAQLTDCMSCPAGSECVSGDPNPIPCPPGHYCPVDSVSIPCPVGTYRDEVSGHTPSDCFSCPAGYFCDDTAIANFTSFPCPAGHFCLERTEKPILCPPGTSRNTSGGASVDDCSLCLEGYFCPPRYCQPEIEELQTNVSFVMNISDFESSGFFFASGFGDTYNFTETSSELNNTCDYENINVTCPEMCTCDSTLSVDSHIHGISCRAGYYCPAGSTEELLCPGGHICLSRAGVPIPCRAGYFCSPGSEVETICEYPIYCSEETSDPLLCSAGYIARNVSESNDTLRTSLDNSCIECQAGTFSTDGVACQVCPEGFYCPRATSYPLECEKGHYCPEGSANGVACRSGTYNGQMGSINETDCLLCPEGTYSNSQGNV